LFSSTIFLSQLSKIMYIHALSLDRVSGVVTCAMVKAVTCAPLV
jgi:hypothetical protein